MLSCFHILKYSSDDARDDGDYDLFLTVKMLRHDDNDEKHKADHTGCSLVPLENQVKGAQWPESSHHYSYHQGGEYINHYLK